MAAVRKGEHVYIFVDNETSADQHDQLYRMTNTYFYH